MLAPQLAGVAAARDVTFPIRVDERFLTSELLRTAYTDPGETARLIDDDSGCSSLVLFEPKVTAEDGRLRVRTAGEARFGVSAGGRCLLPLSWSGLVELIEEPWLDPRSPTVRFVVVDSRILDADGDEPLFSGTLWGWIKRYVHPRLETRIDLQEPVDELRRLLPAFGVADTGQPARGSARVGRARRRSRSSPAPCRCACACRCPRRRSRAPARRRRSARSRRSARRSSSAGG